MKNLVIRTAAPADLPVLLEFEQGIIATEQLFDPTLQPGHFHYYPLGEMLQREDAVVAVAEMEGQVVGSGFARIESAKPFLQHRQHAYLGFMFVLPEWRGQGVNRLLMDFLQKWAASRGIHELRLHVYPANEAAVKAYEKAGFTKHLLEMRLGTAPHREEA